MLCEWQWVFFLPFDILTWPIMRQPPARLFSPFQRAATTKETFFENNLWPSKVGCNVCLFFSLPCFLLFSYSHILSASCFQMHSSAFSFSTYCILCSAFWLPSLFLELFFPVPFGSPGTRSETLTVAEYRVNQAFARSVEFRWGLWEPSFVYAIVPRGPWHHFIAGVAERSVNLCLTCYHLQSKV